MRQDASLMPGVSFARFRSRPRLSRRFLRGLPSLTCISSPDAPGGVK
jgi:hypothetical protein